MMRRITIVDLASATKRLIDPGPSSSACARDPEVNADDDDRRIELGDEPGDEASPMREGSEIGLVPSRAEQEGLRAEAYLDLAVRVQTDFVAYSGLRQA
jgi:hypothetical protein